MAKLIVLLVYNIFITSWQFILGTDQNASICHKQAWVHMISTRCICSPCDLCQFNFHERKCVLIHPITTPANNNPWKEPIRIASEWFLTADEITASRGGIPRKDLHTYTSGNTITLFPYTNEFFTSVYNDITKRSNLNYSIYITAWALSNIPLLPASPSIQSSLQTVLGQAMEDQMIVRILAWANAYEFINLAEIQAWVNQHNNNYMIFDTQLPHAWSSHHQKTIIFIPNYLYGNNLLDTNISTDSIVAYVGGIDLTRDRWDTRYHNESTLRLQDGISEDFLGWIDASIRIQGPAALDVAVNFQARWNNLNNTNGNHRDILDNVSNPQANNIPTIPADLYNAIPARGTTNVQIVRTYSCEGGYTFAPKGEESILQARIKAIGLAKNFIYIEDQYFILNEQLQQALLRQLPTLQFIIIFTQEPPSGTQPSFGGFEKWLNEMLKPLQDQFPDKIYTFTTKPGRKIYIHGKVLLIDDVFLSIGSGNWNRRSMTSDSEVTANLVSDEIQSYDAEQESVLNTLAKTFRIQRFSELAGVAPSALAGMTVRHSLDVLNLAARSEKTIIKVLQCPSDLLIAMIPDFLRTVSDPFDVC